jgi:hypothetical protein
MTEELVAMQVEREPLEEPPDVEEAVAALREHLHVVVEALHKPADRPTMEVGRNLIPPSILPRKLANSDSPFCPSMSAQVLPQSTCA